MATEYFTITQNGRQVGEGQIDTDSGDGKIVLYNERNNFMACHYVFGRPSGHHERLPEPGSDQDSVDESMDCKLPW